MFFKSKEKCKCDDYVKCADCQCLINKNDAQNISEKYHGIFEILYFNKYYCKRCKKPYDRIESFNNSNPLFYNSKDRFLKELEVDEKGEPIGYRIKEKI